MPYKKCPKCSTKYGPRKKTCDASDEAGTVCGHIFIKDKPTKSTTKTNKRIKSKVKVKVKPIEKEVASVGTGVWDQPKGMPRPFCPEDLPRGKLTNSEVYDYITYESLGYCIWEYISSRKIEDKELRKLWLKANKAMSEVWNYLDDFLKI